MSRQVISDDSSLGLARDVRRHIVRTVGLTRMSNKGNLDRGVTGCSRGVSESDRSDLEAEMVGRPSATAAEKSLEPHFHFTVRLEADLQPYVIKQGDHLALLAYKFGFDADTVWNDSKNAQLRQRAQLSSDPNILYPTDVLYIPDQNVPPVMKSLTPGTTNSFVSNVPTVTITHQFVGDDASTYASKAYTIQELNELTDLATDSNGIVKFQAPVTLQTATLTFTDSGECWVLSIGVLDPVNTLSGIFQRLQNLGYIGSNLQFDASDLATLRVGLRLLIFSQSTASDSAPASTPVPPSVPPSAPPSAPGSAPASAPGMGVPTSSTDVASDSADASDPPPDSGPPSSEDAPVDTAGLADDGTVDADTSSLLVKVYGF
jgi:hypothetical protein